MYLEGESEENGRKKKERMHVLSFVWLCERKKKKMNAVEWCFFHGIHCFVISSIWAEIGGRESKNFIESTTLYNKMTNTSLTFLRYMNFLIIHKGTIDKNMHFSFLFLLQTKQRKDRIFIYSSSISFLYSNTSKWNIFFSFLSFVLDK